MGAIKSVSHGSHRIRLSTKIPGRQSGVIAIMFASSLVLIFAFFMLALDLSQVYNRKMELQNIADTLALASAYELDGTTQGITNAQQKAVDRFGVLRYQYGKQSMTWSDAVIEFGNSPTGPWHALQDAKAQPSQLLYAKVDTSGLDSSYGEVRTLFLQVFTTSSVTSTTARAVAGRAAINVTPLGICAMRDESHRDHNGELEEYGFRRGVSYNLLDLNRQGLSVGQTFVVNPYVSNTPITDPRILAPFVCTGIMAMTRLTGGKVTVSPSFPISSLFYHLNSRFGSYGASASAPLPICDARLAPADTNVKEYTYNGGSPWMSKTPTGQSAALLQTSDQRWTVAGPDTAPIGTTDIQFGPLWSYAKAVKYSSYAALGEPEPASGYATFDATNANWGNLYNPGKPAISTATPYPTTTPYSAYAYNGTTTFNKLPPATSKPVPYRRVLNLPLLSCPVSGDKATVVGIGKFFMTVSATANSLYGEFAGLASEQSLGTQVQLYP